MFETFSTNAIQIIDDALQIARSLNKKLVGSEHLLLAMYKKKDTICHFLLDEKQITYDDILRVIHNLVIFRKSDSQSLTYTKKFQEIILYSETLAKDLGSKYVYDEHIFYVMLKEEDSIASIVLEKLGLDIEDLMIDIEEIFNFFEGTSEKEDLEITPYPFLTNLSKTKKVHPFIKRSNYIEKIIYILSKKQKNNPLLIGNAGVGKTAIIEGLSEILKNETIYQLDLGSIVSGTKYRGELEEKITKAMEYIKKHHAIVFIDEIHNIVGAGSNDGSLDIANILKPYLSRSDIKLIGSTTLDEYYRFIEKDKALTRRFQNVYIDEPNEAETYEILEGIKQSYEEYHQVKYSSYSLQKIITNAKLFLINKSFPDKAIDILDEVSSSISIRQTNEGKKLNQLKKERNEIQKVKNSYILDNNLREAYLALKKESALTSAINEFELKNQSCCKVVALEDVAEVIHEKTGIPVYEILKEKVNMVEKLERELKNCVVGQDKAIQELIQATKKMKFGYANHRVKSYLFVGPTGVGKTNLAVSYAKFLNGEKNLIRLDMSEYADATSINKIIGSAPGYVGYEDNNNVLTKIKEKPTAVILLDEIDKANSSVLNLLYQILDVGELTDAKNNTVSFRNNIIIMTSNLGFEESRVGFSQDKCSSLESSLKQKMPLPLLNRIDSVISFNFLTEKDIVCIVKRQLKKLEGKYLDLKLAPNLVLEIVKESNYQQYGARRIAKIIENKVESQIIDRVMNKEKLEVSTLVLQEAK